MNCHAKISMIHCYVKEQVAEICAQFNFIFTKYVCIHVYCHCFFSHVVGKYMKGYPSLFVVITSEHRVREEQSFPLYSCEYIELLYQLPIILYWGKTNTIYLLGVRGRFKSPFQDLTYYHSLMKIFPVFQYLQKIKILQPSSVTSS